MGRHSHVELEFSVRCVGAGMTFSVWFGLQKVHQHLTLFYVCLCYAHKHTSTHRRKNTHTHTCVCVCVCACACACLCVGVCERQRERLREIEMAHMVSHYIPCDHVTSATCVNKTKTGSMTHNKRAHLTLAWATTEVSALEGRGPTRGEQD